MRPQIRDPRGFWTGAIFLAVGLAAVWIGRDYPMGSATRMGPAFFPTALGALLAVLGLAALVMALTRPGEGTGAWAIREATLILGATVLFGVLVRGAGLVVAVLALVLVSSAASPNVRWGPALLLAVALAVFSVLVFVYGLGLPLPAVGSWLVD